MFSYSRQLASALDYCHINGVLHLDVKPANIMVNSQQWIKLGDFGNSISVHQLDCFQVIICFPVISPFPVSLSNFSLLSSNELEQFHIVLQKFCKVIYPQQSLMSTHMELLFGNFITIRYPSLVWAGQQWLTWYKINQKCYRHNN